MKLPIFLYDNGDISIFQSVVHAENYIESPDILDNEYIVFDADGIPLKLSTSKQAKFKLFGLELISVSRVSIKEHDNDIKVDDKLKIALKAVLLKLDVNNEYVNNADLNDLVNMSIEKIGYS
jgi:hypothetical protein